MEGSHGIFFYIKSHLHWRLFNNRSHSGRDRVLSENIDWKYRERKNDKEMDVEWYTGYQFWKDF